MKMIFRESVGWIRLIGRELCIIFMLQLFYLAFIYLSSFEVPMGFGYGHNSFWLYPELLLIALYLRYYHGFKTPSGRFREILTRTVIIIVQYLLPLSLIIIQVHSFLATHSSLYKSLPDWLMTLNMLAIMPFSLIAAFPDPIIALYALLRPRKEKIWDLDHEPMPKISLMTVTLLHILTSLLFMAVTWRVFDYAFSIGMLTGQPDVSLAGWIMVIQRPFLLLCCIGLAWSITHILPLNRLAGFILLWIAVYFASDLCVTKLHYYLIHKIHAANHLVVEIWHGYTVFGVGILFAALGWIIAKTQVQEIENQ